MEGLPFRARRRINGDRCGSYNTSTGIHYGRAAPRRSRPGVRQTGAAARRNASGVRRTGAAVCRTGNGVRQIGAAVCRTGDGVRQTDADPHRKGVRARRSRAAARPTLAGVRRHARGYAAAAPRNVGTAPRGTPGLRRRAADSPGPRRQRTELRQTRTGIGPTRPGLRLTNQ